ncbi:MAG: glycoside hydrolase family 99-like domain-containing protein [Butyrivibrio sp.]|nr:glycoside hydrolase family 99-like domain-containing protein [Butyrivibrio sp.]
MKIIAMYLPQFHTIPENDLWWGEGYTEWTAVKSAESVTNDHYQPRVPLDGNYYDLLNKETMEWQADLMHKYGVYGMCFYHYYFENGRRVLEKPAENLLKWHDINMPFCFSWANETWARSWSRISGTNAWNSKLEKQDGKDGILIRQDYGDESLWREHLEYLIPFFNDERYIRVNDRPVFIIHKPGDIHCLERMKDKWNEWASEYGIPGVFFIGVNSNDGSLDATMQQEANYSDLFIPSVNKSYEELSEQIITNAYVSDDNCYLCATPGYDDTPRRGKSGEIVYGSTPEKFYEQLKALIYLSEQKGKDMLFVNAWNEWGEGMYLEPDERFGYGYLEAIKRAQDNASFTDEEVDKINRVIREGAIRQLRMQREKILKFKDTSDLFEKMLLLKESDRSMAHQLKEKGIGSVAVYGLGKIGKHVLEDLRNEGVAIAFGIDNKVTSQAFDFAVYDSEMVLPKTDLIIMTFNDEIEKNRLSSVVDCPVLTIRELVDSAGKC